MEHLKGIFGLLGIWTTWFVAHMATIQTWASIAASIAATIASIIYGRYLLGKMSDDKKDRKTVDYKSNGHQK